MLPKYAFFDVAAGLVLCGLTIIGAVAALLGWIATKPEHKEGVRTIGGRRLARSRVSLTAGCVAVWACTFLGCVVTGPKSPSLAFGFWQDYPVALQTLFFPIDAAFVASVFFAAEARGRGRLILLIATAILAVASLAGSTLLWTP
jgi:hypothetical protein